MVSKSNTAAVVNVLPVFAKLALSVSPVPLTNVYVNVSPASASVVLKEATVVPEAAFSATELALTLIFVGASFTSVTLMVNTFSNVKPPASVTRTLTL